MQYKSSGRVHDFCALFRVHPDTSPAPLDCVSSLREGFYARTDGKIAMNATAALATARFLKYLLPVFILNKYTRVYYLFGT